MEKIVQFRKALHRTPELSGFESGTARAICDFFAPLQPDSLIQNIGGHGVAVLFNGQSAGPTVMLRCELDALPPEVFRYC